MKISRIWPRRRARTRSPGATADEGPAAAEGQRAASEARPAAPEEPPAAEESAGYGPKVDPGGSVANPAAAPPVVEAPSRDGAGAGAPTGAPPGSPPPARAVRRLSARDRRRLMWAAAAIVLVVLVVLWLRPDPLEVEAAQVTRGPLRVTVDEEGTTRVRERFTVSAPVTGRLQRIPLEEGDGVSTGDVVARLAPAPLDVVSSVQALARVRAAEAQREEAVARAEQARDALDQAGRAASRTRVLADAGAVSREERELAELALSNAEREHSAARDRVDAASAEIDAARAALVNTSPAPAGDLAVVAVRAPAGGRVLRVLEESERVVPAGTPLLEVGNARALEAVIDVLSSDAVRVFPGAPVLIEEWGGPTALQGTVRSVEPAAFTRVSALGVEEQRVNVVAVLPGAPASLGDGFRVEARIVVWSAADVLRVPIGALFRSGNGWAVYVVERGRARLREVTPGERGATDAEVRAGLREGETVVVYPPDRLEHGTRVRIE